jgi:hypothetical protein
VAEEDEDEEEEKCLLVSFRKRKTIFSPLLFSPLLFFLLLHFSLSLSKLDELQR